VQCGLGVCGTGRDGEDVSDNLHLLGVLEMELCERKVQRSAESEMSRNEVKDKTRRGRPAYSGQTPSGWLISRRP
jgi:hypothetical protein